MPLRNVLCSHCGLVFLDPMPTPEEIERYYRDEYRQHYHGDSSPRAKALLRDERGARERVALLAPLLRQDDDVLDIGAGTGAFTAAAAAAGWNTVGVEPHQGFAAFAQSHYRARVHATTLEQAPLTAGSFNLVSSSHVFEHLRAPEQAFALVHRLLKPGGVFHVNVPDISDPLRSPNARWHFGHVHGFTRKTLSMLAWRSGFEVLPESPSSGPHLLLRKLEQPVDDWMRHPEHAAEMAQFFAEHTPWRHFTSATPYRRFLARMRRFSGERRRLRKG
jgi:SAM-dependent methyltransferase